MSVKDKSVSSKVFGSAIERLPFDVETKYDLRAEEYDRNFEGYGYAAPNFLFNRLAKYINVQDHPKLKLLDVGIGTGMLSIKFKHASCRHHVTGIDLSSKMLRECERKRAADRLVKIDFQKEALPFGREEFNMIVSSGVFELLLHPEKVIASLGPILQKGSILAFTTLDNAKAHKQIETPAGLVHEEARIDYGLEQGGFKKRETCVFKMHNKTRCKQKYKLYIAQKL